MKLTRRQEEFIKKLHELNREMNGPIHYSLLAEHLGVSPFTAYDMLCLLEEKGLAFSEYKLASDKSGPGRAERVFYPSEKALVEKHALLENVGIQPWDSDGLEQFMLERLRKEEHPDKELTEQMLARIPPEVQGGALQYCMEVMTVITLRLRQSDSQDFARYWREVFSFDYPAHFTNFIILAGFASGILARDCISDPEWVSQLLVHVNQYSEIVCELEADELEQLYNHLKDMFKQFADGMDF